MKKDRIEKTTRYKILDRQGWKCKQCGVKLKFNKHSLFKGQVAHIDHIFPQALKKEYLGFIGNVNNLQALCPSCNFKKGKKIGV